MTKNRTCFTCQKPLSGPLNVRYCQEHRIIIRKYADRIERMEDRANSQLRILRLQKEKVERAINGWEALLAELKVGES